MRCLVLLRGSPGSGKSTFIKENKLEQYTINADEIRLLFQTPIFYPDGSLGISQANDKKVWELIFQLLEARMERGEFTIIDATHSKPSDFAKYKVLREKYRYRFYCVDFSDVPIEVTKARNLARETYRWVPEEVIDNMYARIKSFNIPGYVTVIKPEQFQQTFRYNIQDYSRYKKIHHIGDIHGCFDPLHEYFADGFKDDELYIFIGDYIDRGIQNVEVLKFLMEAIKRPNVIMLEGNHEIWLWKWANDERIQSREFEFSTQPQLEAAEIEKADVRQFYRKLAQLVYYNYHGKRVFVCHGGLSTLPENLIFVATEQLVRGVGKYADMMKTTESFAKSAPENMIQVFGHRNIDCLPIELGCCRNICDKIEFGGNLRVYTIDSDGKEEYIEIKNGTIKAKPNKDIPQTRAQNSVAELVAELEKYPADISKRDCSGNIYSYNFSREVFSKSTWNTLTIKARGLFINTFMNEIVARSYDKFHNVGQRGTTLYDLKRRMKFPATAYVKENGYLGITGYDTESDQVFTASKSTNTGQYAEMFRGRLVAALSQAKSYDEFNVRRDEFMARYDEFKTLLRDRSLSALFEVIEPEHDPHIIEYPKSKLVLLDLVERTPEFKKLAYPELCEIAAKFGFEVKQKAYTFHTWEEFESWYTDVIKQGWRYNEENIEGFVVEDANGYMTKVKLDFYAFWKQMRTYMASLSKGHKINYGALYESRMNEVFGFMRKKQEEGKLVSYKSIIELRKDYEAAQLEV